MPSTKSIFAEINRDKAKTPWATPKPKEPEVVRRSEAVHPKGTGEPPEETRDKQETVDPPEWKKRREAVLKFAKPHPCTIDEIQRFYPQCKTAKARYNVAQRCVQWLLRNGIKVVGVVRDGKGRPKHMYCGWYPKRDTLPHELWITLVCMIWLSVAKFLRGKHTGPQRADFVMFLNHRKFYGELDSGTMSIEAAQRRLLKAYKPSDCILFITSDIARLETVKAGLKDLNVWYAVLDDLLKAGRRTVWVNYEGHRETI
jgi:hypothetical protein